MRPHERLGAVTALLACAPALWTTLTIGAGATASLLVPLVTARPVPGTAVLLLLTAPLTLAGALAVRRTPWPTVGVAALLVVATAVVTARYAHLLPGWGVAAAGAFVVLLTGTAALAAASSAGSGAAGATRVSPRS